MAGRRDQQYADDINWASTNKTVLEKIETIIPEVLKERNLFVNESKTEKYTVSRNTHEWKDCKLLGSKLETVNDIENLIKLVNYSYSTLQPILSQKECNTDIKLSIFNALIESIFLYNSEIWSLTQALENDIDVFQRKLLRKIMGYKYTENREYWT